MLAEELKKQQQIETETSNQILRLLNELPRKVSDAIEIKLREEFRGKWFQTWRSPEYNPARIRAVDMKRLMILLDVPEEFFLGTREQIADCIRRAVVKHQTSVAA